MLPFAVISKQISISQSRLKLCYIVVVQCSLDLENALDCTSDAISPETYLEISAQVLLPDKTATISKLFRTI